MIKETALEIINSSINSAIFIDEKARSFYSESAIDDTIPEEKLSIALFNTFKSNGKKISIHRFNPTDLNDDQIIKYLFNNRDLILLDWQLAEYNGEEHSLALIQKAVETPNINFCCIYSNIGNSDDITNQLYAYFSNLTKEEFERISSEYSHIDNNEIEPVLDKNDCEIESFMSKNKINIEHKCFTNIKKYPLSQIIRIIYISLNISKYIIPNNREEKYTIKQANSNTIIINNTFIFSLKKEIISDNYNKLLSRITDQVIKNERSFFQLLGLEMHNLFNSKEHFIDKALLQNSTESILQLRKHIGNDDHFKTIIKKLMIEQFSIKIRPTQMNSLNEKFLDSLSNSFNERQVEIEELKHLNIFLNSVSINEEESRIKLNFGDILKSKNDYYLCITPLCDCFREEKIEYKYTFVKGSIISPKLAMSLGDTSFISFLPNNDIVYWGSKSPNTSTEDTDSADESASTLLTTENLETLKKDLELLKSDHDKLKYEVEQTLSQYKPLIIKPIHIYIYSPYIVEKELNVEFLNYKSKTKRHEFKNKTLQYITTLRSEYAQRIMNQTSAHYIRVGVDFINKK